MKIEKATYYGTVRRDRKWLYGDIRYVTFSGDNGEELNILEALSNLGDKFPEGTQVRITIEVDE